MEMIRRNPFRQCFDVLVPLLLLILVGGRPALAQKTTGEVRGTVTDTTGAVVPGATVTVTSADTGVTRNVTTETKGEFAFPLLQPGRYRLEVTAPSFKKYTTEVSLQALETASVTAKLEVGDMSEEVLVSGAAEGVNVSTGGVEQRLAQELLSEFPNLNRYGFANAPLMPAITQAEERRETINSSVAGNVANRNSFYIDGAEATDPWRGWSPRQPVVDAFEEIIVSTAGATVDMGANFGGTYNAIFKSGTNTFRGGAWYYFRDKGLNANSWVNNRVGLEKPDDPLKYWGAQVGGPILKDKLFFYVTMNRETDRQPYSQTGLYAPTAAMVSGDFSALPFTILNPDTGQPFPGNRIPTSLLDPTAAAFWKEYGYTIPSYGPNYSYQFANERKVWNFNGRVDYNLSSKHRLTLSGYYFKNSTISPDARVQSISGSPSGGTTGNTFNKGGNEVSAFPQTVFNLKHTWTPKTNVFIETHGAFSDMPERVTLDDESLGTTLASLGANDPLPRPNAPELLPSIVIGQWWGSPETAVLFHGWTTDFEVKNLSLGSSVTWITGSHNLKLGAEFQGGSYHDIQVARENQNGLTFNGNATSNNNPSGGGLGSAFAHSFADFLLGRFDSYGVNDQSERTLSSTNLALYAMDQWRVTPRFTLTPGLRFEINSGISEENGQLTLYRPGLQSTRFPNAPRGIVVAGDAGLPDSLSGSSFKVAPRINGAYDLSGDGKTAIRASAGLYHGRDVMALWQTGFLGRAPFTGSTAVARNGILSNPWLTSRNPTYTAVPFPFLDQDPAAYRWPSQLSGFYSLDPSYSLPSSWQWNAAIERELFKGVRLELSYQGNSSTTTPTSLPTNLAAFAPGATDSAANIQSRRPNQLFGDNLPVIVNEGRTRYDQFLLIGRVRRPGLFGQVSWAYTHGRRNFNGQAPGLAGTVSNNRDWDQGVTSAPYPDLLLDFQNNQTLAGFLVWELPILKGSKSVAGNLLGGWSISMDGNLSFNNKGQSAYLGYDANADGYGADFAELVSDVTYPRAPITGQGDLLYRWFDTSAFAFPGGGTTRLFTGTTTRTGAGAINELPGSWNVNSSLMKNFRLREETRLQFRLEIYNLFNHANLNSPNTSLTSPDFGTIRGKYGDGRRAQLGLRLMF